MRRMFATLVVVMSLALLPQGARAAWRESSSNHFVVYGETGAENLRRFSEQLERYHAAMALVTGVDIPPPSPSNRVTVFLVDDSADVRKLMLGKPSRYVGGFYLPRAGGSLAVIPKVRSASGSGGDLEWSMVVLLHEYAHHFLISNSGFPSPRWMSEGAAEFFASANFTSDGGVGLGRPAVHRAYELAAERDVTATDLLDPDFYEKRRGKSTSYDAFYGKSWLLYHYLTFEPARKGQIGRYSSALLAGKSLPDAGREAFGDFKQLEKELNSYLNRPRLYYIKLAGTALNPGPIAVRDLRPGEAAVMPVRIRSKVGVNEELAPQALADARAVAAQYPNDPAVLSALAEAEFDAGNDAEAIAAADAAIKLNPREVNAYVQKGYAMFHMAETADDLAKAYRAARDPFLDLNAFENDHPLPLLYFYLSYGRQGREPTANAVAGLERASEVSPFDLGLRMTVAMQQLHDGRQALARANLVPVAYKPHGGSMAERARKIIERIDRDPQWRGEGAPEEMPGEDGGDEGDGGNG